MTKNRFYQLEKQTQILKDLAEAWPKESKQYVAIENAALALIFVLSEHYDTFISYVNSCSDDLTEEQKNNLKDVGIHIEKGTKGDR